MNDLDIKLIKTWAKRDRDVEKSFRKVKRADHVKRLQAGSRIRAQFRGIMISERTFDIYVDMLMSGEMKKVIFERPGTQEQYLLMSRKADQSLRALRMAMPEILSKDPRCRDLVWMTEHKIAA